MMRRLLLHRVGRAKALWMLCVVLAPALCAQPFAIMDDRGVRVEFAESPQRIVSILPSLTESVCALGACSRLVGVDRYANWPALVKALPKVGGGLDPNIEAIVALKPDVVLMAVSTRVHERLNALGIKVIALKSDSMGDLQRVLQLLETLLHPSTRKNGRPAAAKPGPPGLWDQLQAELAAAALTVPKHLRGQRVYFEISSAPHAAGPKSFIGELLTRMGARNIVPPELGAFPQLSPEFIVRANPDLIIIGDRNNASMRERPGWGLIKAVRTQRVCQFSAEQIDVLVRPRLNEAARLLARCLRGEPTLMRP
jgi:iron complex transport system substrate-binding protein